jgi:hypothetical protein
VVHCVSTLWDITGSDRPGRISSTIQHLTRQIADLVFNWGTHAGCQLVLGSFVLPGVHNQGQSLHNKLVAQNQPGE